MTYMTHVLENKTEAAICKVIMALTKKSEYLAQLSTETKTRYELKVTSTGLNVDPYCIDESLWTREPEVIPKMMWTDILFYMVSTPSPYTKEAIKVSI